MFMPSLRSFLLLILQSFIALAIVDASNLPKSITLSYELIGFPSVKPLVTVFYDPKSLKYSLSSWNPPNLDSLTSTTPESTSKLLRILLPNGSSTITTLDTFNQDLHQKIDLWISPDDGTVFSASVSSLSPPPLSPEEERYRKKVERAKAKGKPIPARPPVPNTKKAREEAAKAAAMYEPIKVNLLISGPGPAPSLATRKPPQVDSEGREIPQEERQEKSFFQKYWWVFLIIAMLTMTGGGQDK
ncbi:uncharacterized protein Z518_08530 [Rhinocladiella mackenziei CBS 650.93]|uniref:ER membrane protein complex subunit 10 n=1 Tax=Rhinocladiella mackenziei CBS 650.93 TaxID=1442369 RepID=A0A0D2I9P3_9EURO|nr:uncharacterized protein Z518_08530 [Rhinocladiella mackenziei CBS 650.93]KIX02589.1 hypothetical protein Z518_08530 [Rhinocladiella mackenziei CBS 650.93]